jgi:branched-subunit amino acid aminotransferase/4-amino-4-deoxychorismate lyase
LLRLPVLPPSATAATEPESEPPPVGQAAVPVFDRSFLYGDGLFETLRVANGRPFRWGQHLERLRRGGDFLGLKIPFGCKALEQFAAELIAKNQMPEALLRVTVSRGVGPRGYSPRGADRPVLVMTLHPLPGAPAAHPPRWRLITSSFRLAAGERLAHFKNQWSCRGRRQQQPVLG